MPQCFLPSESPPRPFFTSDNHDCRKLSCPSVMPDNGPYQVFGASPGAGISLRNTSGAVVPVLLDILAQGGVDPRLVAVAAGLEPLHHVGIQPQRG